MGMESKVRATMATRWLVACAVAFLAGEAPCARASPVDPAVAPPTISEFLTAPERLQITETAGALALLGATGGVAHIDPSGRWTRGQDGRQFRARWKDAALITEVRSDGGPKSTTTYRLLAEKRQLEVLSRLDLAAGGSVLVRRVYDTAETEGHIV